MIGFCFNVPDGVVNGPAPTKTTHLDAYEGVINGPGFAVLLVSHVIDNG